MIRYRKLCCMFASQHSKNNLLPYLPLLGMFLRYILIRCRLLRGVYMIEYCYSMYRLVDFHTSMLDMRHMSYRLLCTFVQG